MPEKTFFVQVKKSGGKHPLQWIKEVDDKIHFDFQLRLVELGEQTASRMGEIIKFSLKRGSSTGLLENSIKSVVLDSVGGVHIGIGQTELMPPYWEVIDDGGYVPPPNIGTFESGAPKAGASGEQWYHTGGQEKVFGFNELYYLNPKKPIEPVKYSAIADLELNIHIANELKRLYKEIDKAAK